MGVLLAVCSVVCDASLGSVQDLSDVAETDDSVDCVDCEDEASSQIVVAYVVSVCCGLQMSEGVPVTSSGYLLLAFVTDVHAT